MPRIAIIGDMPEISTPVMFSAMNQRLTISSAEVGQTLMIYYRSPAAADASGRIHDMTMPDPVKMVSKPDLWEVVERLGGIANDDERPLDFSYSEVVAILHRLSEAKKLVAFRDGQALPASFFMENPPALQNTIYNAPSIDTGRPQFDEKNPQAAHPSGPTDPAADAAMAGK